MIARARPSALSLVLACWLAGCDCGGPAPDGPDAGTASDAAIADDPDAATAPDGGGDVDAALPTLPRTRHYGSVLLEQYTEPPGDHAALADASFADATTGPRRDVVDSAGAGCFLRVELTDFASGYPEPNADSGRIDIASSATEEVLVLDVPSGGTSDYDALRFAEPRWATGERLSITSVGGDVPAFETQLTVPHAVAFAVPAEPAPTDRIPLDHDADYEVRWEPAPDGLAYVAFTQSVVGGETLRTMSLQCVFPAADGRATIPRDAMRALAPSSTGAITLVWAGGASVVDLASGDYAIRVQSRMTTLTSSADVR